MGGGREGKGRDGRDTFSPAVFFCVCLHAMLHVLRSPLIVRILHFFAMIVTEGTPVRPRTRIYCLCPANR